MTFHIGQISLIILNFWQKNPSNSIGIISEFCLLDGQKKRAVSGNPAQYVWVTDQGEQVLPCPVGTEFNYTQCLCDHAAGRDNDLLFSCLLHPPFMLSYCYLLL